MARAFISGMMLVLALGCARVGAQEPPPLEPPEEAGASPRTQDGSPPVVKVETPKPVVSQPPAETTQAPVKPPIRPLLVIPGVTAPASNPTRPSAGASPRSRQPRTQTPPLTGPTDPMLDRRGVVQSRVEPRVTVEPPIPLTLEPIEDLPADEPHPASPRTGNGANRVTRPTPSQPPAPPRGFFARLFGIPAPAERPRPTTPPIEPSRPLSRAGAGTPDDPGRALEREIQKTLGDRARSIEVRVSGKNALVVVKPTRFWQKRAIRATLEAMPSLARYHARIDVLD